MATIAPSTEDTPLNKLSCKPKLASFTAQTKATPRQITIKSKKDKAK